MGAMRPWHWVVVAIVVLILFGAKKLPDFARSLGQSLRIFKSETKALKDDDQAPASDTGGTGTAPGSVGTPSTAAAPPPHVPSDGAPSSQRSDG